MLFDINVRHLKMKKNRVNRVKFLINELMSRYDNSRGVNAFN